MMMSSVFLDVSSLKQGDCCELENSLNYIERPYHRKRKKKGRKEKRKKKERKNYKQINKNLGTFRASKMAQ